MLKNGRPFKVKGKKVLLYPISTLASELTRVLKENRTTQTIRKWEVKGVLPNATFRFKGKRFYAEEQIRTICKVAKECNIKQGASLTLTNFSIRVKEELAEVNKELLGLNK